MLLGAYAEATSTLAAVTGTLVDHAGYGGKKFAEILQRVQEAKKAVADAREALKQHRQEHGC